MQRKIVDEMETGIEADIVGTMNKTLFYESGRIYNS